MPRIKVHPYKQGSHSAKALATALGGRVLKLEGSGYQPRPADVVINWGASGCPQYGQARILNSNEAIARASNKSTAFDALAAGSVSIPLFAKQPGDVSWDAATVVRHKLTGHSGEGIEIVEPGLPLPNAPLYVQYIKKQDEYRIHVIGGQVAVVQKKARRLETPDAEVNWQVRNHHNGFVFVRNSGGGPDGVGAPITCPEQVLEQSKGAIAALGLDFGAVDVIWNVGQQKAYVLEVNTAPGLEGTTVTDYAQAFQEMLNHG